MSDADFDAALAAEERALLAQIREEPGYLTQMGSLFRGRSGWVNVMMMLAQTLLFAAGVYATIQFFDAREPLGALRWGLPGAVLLLASLMIKLALWPVIQTNRLLRAIKRLELHLASRAA